ncbi:uncharacterized protein NECHADRAFT_76307 [Fusarium vanettenii 77-13-4]|uniref:Cellobiose dehydrogenase cytochrome domain-containing protein n=1 Tax=Fusarium vanettenii (strain ATCC MYA-4622 / CBS 123669 / FGSC 9596 / NRRL 45880 / 77-13-4) TaxID=660122 RepID=C7Z746_FUSV7|nr:uncharacterized protein NECHADRAFT_76307 [Fusarium vanettenii 77-13-4]EEU40240.1 predicted protein [Fusarium vanettenii 77-13-4]
MRPSLLLPSLLGSVWASPTASPLDVDPALVELGRRAAAAGQPTFNFTQCYVTVKGDPGFQSFQAGTATGTMWLVWGIPPPADNKNGENPVDVVLRVGGGSIGSINFVTNGYLNNFPSVRPGPSIDYVKVKGTAAKFQADVDFSYVPYGQQPQWFATTMSKNIGPPWGPLATYGVTSGFLGLKTTEPTAQNTREVNGAVFFAGGNRNPGYAGYITGSCLGSGTLPLSIV